MKDVEDFNQIDGYKTRFEGVSLFKAIPATMLNTLSSCSILMVLITMVVFLRDAKVLAMYRESDLNHENCETIKSEIHLIKEEFDELGRLQRTCNADVKVNKCEGFCSSQVQPSVITPTGFLKVTTSPF